HSPRWSPDGRRLAYVTPRGRVSIATPGGRILRQIGRAVDSFGWLPGGRHLYIEGPGAWTVSATGRVVFTVPPGLTSSGRGTEGGLRTQRVRASSSPGFVGKDGGGLPAHRRAYSWTGLRTGDGSSQGRSDRVSLRWVQTDGKPERSRLSPRVRRSSVRTGWLARAWSTRASAPSAPTSISAPLRESSAV
ncbi:MAG: PD40 domain-containing protein, partial [Actinobacteria bacterium]|nr:PD40 domain-containing protein [Actinomycetota bacterium]